MSSRPLPSVLKIFEENIMSRISILLCVFFCVAKFSDAQTTYTWVGGSVGDFQDPANWSSPRTTPATTDILAFNATVPIAVANVPNQTISAIHIISGTSAVTFATNLVTNVLTISGAVPLSYSTAGTILAGDLLTIAFTNTGSFTLSTGTFGIAPSTGGKISINSDIILAGGTLDFDVVGAGGTIINSGGSITYTSGIFNCVNNTAITWLNGSDYFHNVSGSSASSIPICTWSNGSTCNITGMNSGTVAPTGLTGINFSNVKWNCTSQIGNVDLNLGGVAANFTGTFTVAGTNTSSLRFASVGTTSLTVGSFSQTGGTLVLQSSTGSTTLTVSNTFSHTAGTIDFVGVGSAGGSAILNLKGLVNKAGTSTWSSTSTNTASQMTIQFSGSSSQSVSIAGTAWNSPAAGRCNIVNSNTDPVGVSLNSSGTAGSLKVTNINSAAPAACSNAGNFTGIGRIVYAGTGVGANNFSLIYNGTVAQTASTVEFPAITGPTALTINNVVGVSFPSSFNRWLTSLSMTAGNLSVGAGNTLTLTSSFLSTQLVYSAGYITSGTLKRYFPTTGLPVDASTSNSRFPFGSGANDRSLYIYFSGTSLTAGTADTISVSHAAIVNATAITPFVDNGVTLDKTTNSNWTISTGSFNLGSGGTTVSILAQANNIGSVDNLANLRLTDAVAGFGTLIPTSGSSDAAVVGKSALTMTNINGKAFYIGSDNTNALQIVTFTWTGATNTSWTNPGNWTGGLGYPSSPTEVAIVNTVGGNMPSIGTGTAISVYQLTVTSPASLTLTGTGSIAVFDNVSFTGSAVFASTSTFNYASSGSAQNIINLPYGTLAVSGSAAKTLPATTIVTGDFSISGTVPTFGTGTFEYAAGTATIQRVAAASYYNLAFSGNRGGNQIRLGSGVANNTIDVANVFTMTASNYVSSDGGFNTLNFSSTGSQTIPGFGYGNITNNTAGGGTRIFDPLGSSDVNHVIVCRSFGLVTTGTVSYTNTGSKVKITRNALATTITGTTGFGYYDFELAGDYAGATLFISGLNVAGSFTVSAINYVSNSTAGTVYYNGTGSQTIAPIDYYNLWIAGASGASGTRVITLPSSGTVGVRNQLAVTGPSTFTSGNGFSVSGSKVNFFIGSNNIPVLTPVVAGGNNYHSIIITGGTRTLAGDIKLGGDLTVTGADGNPVQLSIGNGSNINLTVTGNLSLTGTSASSALTGLIDFNSVNKLVQVKLAGNLAISGTSLLTTGNAPSLKGSILFNGTNQQYTNTAINKNRFVNLIVGDGTSATNLTLGSNIELTRSGIIPYSDTLTIANNATLNVGTQNIKIGVDTASATNNAAFNLNSGATFITGNTGISPNFAIEGTASDGTSGSILSGTNITKNYNAGANYVLNGATLQPFPAAISTMANLTIGAHVSLNKAIVATGTLDLASYTLTQANNNLQFSGLTSTTGKIYADKNSSLSISGSVGTVGPLRFASGGNTTGEFTINRTVTVQLASDLLIDKTPLTGNFITGSASSILDINGNTLTINGAISGTGFLSGSNTSNLTLSGSASAGSIRFAGTQILKNLTLSNSVSASLGTALNITGGLSPNNEGTLSVTGTAILTTAGNLTLKSNANGTSRIAQGATGGGYINGDVTVERYLASNRAWRFLAAPTFGQTIKQSWQENQSAGVNPATGYGTNITSNSANWLANGFDFLTPGNSLLVYNPATNLWEGATNTTGQISGVGLNRAYMLFSRGDRSVTPAVGTPPTTVLVRTKGTVFQGNLPAVPVSTAGQFAAVGNNYAAAIDFTALTNTNIDQSFSVWDPKIPGAQGLGGWVTFSASTSPAWKPVPAGGSYTANVPNTRIESGQAFMVHSTTGSGMVMIKETSKISGSALVLRPFGTSMNKRSISTNLYNMNTGVARIADANVAVFSDGYSKSIDGDDAVKINNFGDNFGLLSGGQTLVVEARQPVADSDTLFFNMKKIKLQAYRLEFVFDNFDNSMTAFLEDKFLKTSTALDPSGTSVVDFTVTSDAGGSAPDRFRIVFKKMAVLPVRFATVSAGQKNIDIEVKWVVENELNVSKYEIELSADGSKFTAGGTVSANGHGSYAWIDGNVAKGENFYRIKSINRDGSFEYSRIVKVSVQKSKDPFTVYPNPVSDGLIALKLNNLSAGTYTTRLVNNAGQLISKNVINHSGGSSVVTIKPAVALLNGSYRLQIKGPENKLSVIDVLVQTGL
jgi:hypothetical protein